MRLLALLLVLATGCGRVGFGGIGTDGGGGGDDAGGGGDDGGGGDPDGAIDGALSPGCGNTVILDDDFADGVIGPAWITVNTGNWLVTEGGGNAQILVTVPVAASSRGGYKQVQSQALPGTCALAELTMATLSTGQYAYLRFGTPTKNVEIVVLDGKVTGRFTNGGAGGTVGSVTYNAQAHRWLRIRVIGNAYHMELGPTATSFPTGLGNIGGVVVDPSPTSLEFGSATGAQMSLVGVVELSTVMLLGP
jgi:hypothetical protein